MSLPETIQRSPLAGRRQPHGWAWIVSACLHGGLLLALIGASVFGGRKEPATTQKPMLVRLGTPRPKEWLPRKPTAPPVPPATKTAPVAAPGEKSAPLPPKPDAKPAPPRPEPKPDAPVKPAPAAAPTPARTQAAAPAEAKQDSRAKLDDIMQRFQAGAIAGPAEDLPGQLDGHPEGDSDRAEGEAYYALLEKRVKDQYKLPATISERERMHLEATVRIFIEANGRITRFEIVKGSGNGVFDGALESAVRRASPVPPPPQHLVKLLAREGVDVNFRP